MNKHEFLKLLKIFNGGILRGSKRKLAKELGITESSVSNLSEGRHSPSEKLIKSMSKTLKTSEENLQKIFEINNTGNIAGNDIIINNQSKELELLKKEVELLKLENKLLKRCSKK